MFTVHCYKYIHDKAHKRLISTPYPNSYINHAAEVEKDMDIQVMNSCHSLSSMSFNKHCLQYH